MFSKLRPLQVFLLWLAAAFGVTANAEVHDVFPAISSGGLGAAKFGMTLSEVRMAVGGAIGDLVLDAKQSQVGIERYFCAFAKVPKLATGSDGVSLLFSKGRLYAIDVSNSAVATPSGIRVGDAIASVRERLARDSTYEVGDARHDSTVQEHRLGSPRYIEGTGWVGNVIVFYVRNGNIFAISSGASQYLVANEYCHADNDNPLIRQAESGLPPAVGKNSEASPATQAQANQAASIGQGGNVSAKKPAQAFRMSTTLIASIAILCVLAIVAVLVWRKEETPKHDTQSADPLSNVRSGPEAKSDPMRSPKSEAETTVGTETWKCSHCGKSNSIANHLCANCLAPVKFAAQKTQSPLSGAALSVPQNMEIPTKTVATVQSDPPTPGESKSETHRNSKHIWLFPVIGGAVGFLVVQPLLFSAEETIIWKIFWHAFREGAIRANDWSEVFKSAMFWKISAGGVAGAMLGTIVGNVLTASDGDSARPHSRAIEPAPSLNGDTRNCPYCAEPIKRAAILCKHCGKSVEPA